MIASVVFCSISCKPLQTDLHAKHDTSVNRSICLQQTANFLRKALFFFITPTVLMVHRKRKNVNKKKTGKRKRWRMVGSRMATRSRYAHWNKTDEEEKLCQNKSPLYGTDLTERHFNTQQPFQQRRTRRCLFPAHVWTEREDDSQSSISFNVKDTVLTKWWPSLIHTPLVTYRHPLSLP